MYRIELMPAQRKLTLPKEEFGGIVSHTLRTAAQIISWGMRVGMREY
jgi:hypothetical protein